MKKYILALIIGCCLLSNNALAANVWTSYKKVVKIQTIGIAGIIVYFDSTVNASCSSAGINSVYIYSGENGVDDVGLQLIMSLVLTAFTAGKEINVMYDDVTNNCYGEYVVLQ